MSSSLALPSLVLLFVLVLPFVVPLPPLRLLAVFPPTGGPFGRALRRAVSDADAGLVERGVTLQAAAPFHSPKGPQDLLAGLCGALREGGPPSALLSFAGPPLSFYVALVGAHARLPVVGVTGGYEDRAAQHIHPYYVSLDPGPRDLALAASRLLLATCGEGGGALVIWDSTSAFFSAFAATLSTATANTTTAVRHVKVDPLWPDGRLFERVSDGLHGEGVRVAVVACGRLLATRLMRQAANLLPDGRWTWILVEGAFSPDGGGAEEEEEVLPAGALGIRLRPSVPSVREAIRASVLFFAASVAEGDVRPWDNYTSLPPYNCWFEPGTAREGFAKYLHSAMVDRRRRRDTTSSIFDVHALLPGSRHEPKSGWRRIGNVTGDGRVSLEALVFRGRGHPAARVRYRVVTAFAPPFVMPATRVENGSCLLGLPCLQVRTRSRVDLSRLFGDFRGPRLLEGADYNVSCCAGVAIDLMGALARDLHFDVDLYLVADGYFGTRRAGKWNGVTLDLVSGAAHLAFTAFSLTRERARAVDYSSPFRHSGVSCLAHTRERDVPLSAFLVPFSVQLWVAIFFCLNVTAVFAAVYEWLSPFGLNPWGRMRTRNFSLSSALWVMWSLLFSHLVAFKAPKSWPNKVLINLWGCFSVIFVSSYTANIAAHFAGLFFHLRVDDFHDASLLHQRTGAAKGSAAESYIHAQNPQLWQHIRHFGFQDLDEGMRKLRSGELDVLVGDTVVLEYFRGNDHGCGLHLLGPPIFEDAYAVGMAKGHRLKESISRLILRYNEYGLVEQLERRWFGRVPCFNHSVHRLNKPQPLSLRSVAGVFLMLLGGAGVGIVILLVEHAVFKHALPQLRRKPPDSFWKTPNVMFFSQKLYRFVNTVELVSPHHSAKEIVANLKEGQIFSLFQKSVKRKAKEEARRRKSKSQFFDIIQEIRKVVKLQKEQPRNPDPALTPLQATIEARPLPPSPFSIPPSSPPPRHNNRTSWTDLYRKVPFSSSSARYSHLHQCDDQPPLARNDSLLEDWSADDPLDAAPVLSISVEDLRLAESGFRSLRRHRSLEEVVVPWRSPPAKRKKAPTSSEPKMAAARRTLLEMDELVLYSMSKEEIVRAWRASERRLLNRLQEAVREKQALERRLAFVRKTLLVKPP